jgi:preprotein translocase subunit SecY
MPYISVSIIVQLLGFAVPFFQKLQKEGETGQRRLNQLTRYITIVITILQGSAYLNYLKYSFDGVISPAIPPSIFWFANILILTAGTIFCMWLGERITDKGIGNGISLLITAGIIAALPSAFSSEFTIKLSGTGGGLLMLVVEMVLFVGVVMAAIALVQAVRKIQIQFAKHMLGRTEIANDITGRDYIPIKLNASGVMPIIFAQALMFIPGAIGGAFGFDPSGDSFLAQFSNYKSLPYNILFFVLVVVFTYVYTALVVNPQQYAEHLKRQNAFIPGIDQAHAEEYIDKVVSLITFPGALALGLIAIMPSFAGSLLTNNDSFAIFYGGTSLLILVAVVLDTLQQIEGHLLMRHYDGLIKSGNIKGRNAEKIPTV